MLQNKHNAYEQPTDYSVIIGITIFYLHLFLYCIFKLLFSENYVMIPLMVRASVQWLRGRKFDSWLLRRQVMTLAKLFTHTLFATKHHNLVPAKGRWCSLAGKVTAGLVESNGSLPLGSWLCHLQADCLETWISSRPLSSLIRVWDYIYLYL